ncbi:MAG: hypothetical protein V4689_18575 [Verrucomicrobiota bacterium]
MSFPSTVALFLFAAISPVTAGTVVITTLPDASHPLAALNSLGGVPLAAGTEVRVGAFQGMSDDAVLDAAANGGFAQIAAAFVPFGIGHVIGDGVDGAAGNFEIAVQQALADSTAPCANEEVSLLIKKGDGLEFLVARFKGRLFEVDPDTGLEPLLSLHLADAKVIVGNRYGVRNLSTSSAPDAGSYDAWIGGFSNISDAAKRLPGADPDGDGRSNFLEYATGGDPDSPRDQPPCQLVKDDEGDFWIRFSRAAGIGSTQPLIQSSNTLVSPWLPLEGGIEPDPNPPSAGEGLQWIRMRVPQSVEPSGYFRLKAASDP